MRKEQPSWAWWIEQGATTLWEDWADGDSRCHVGLTLAEDLSREGLQSLNQGRVGNVAPELVELTGGKQAVGRE